MSFPIVAFLILYLLFAAIWLIFSLIALYHIIKYGQVNFFTFLAAFAYLAGSFFILYFSYLYLNKIDWGANLTIIQTGSSLFGSDF